MSGQYSISSLTNHENKSEMEPKKGKRRKYKGK